MASTLQHLAEVTGGSLRGEGTVMVNDATHDSRQAGAGTLFVALRGAHHDGHSFAREAVTAGSPAVCVERSLEVAVPQLVVGDTRVALPDLAAEIHAHPSRSLTVIGVTGTNGKTTVTHLLEAIGNTAGRVTGLVGTVQTRVGGRLIPNPRTTPEASDWQRILRVMAEAGVELVAAEVSSHALALRRVDRTRFAVGAFTNLTQDHLDFHPDMESYFAAKALLIERAERSVVWIDDPYGRRLAAAHPGVLTAGRRGEVRAEVFAAGLEGTSFRLVLPDTAAEVRLPLPGVFNLANALIAAGCAWLVGIEVGEITAGLEGAGVVPGRFEIVSGQDPVTVVVDYAHTPDGIVTVLASARRLASGRLLVVFGAGGDRDPGKRPRMGEAASAADLVVVTSDNPRSEEPEVIVDQVLAGVTNPARLRVVDRREAIAAALGEARAGDMVLVLGRGHERAQEVADRLLPFDDRRVAREELARLRGEAGS